MPVAPKGRTREAGAGAVKIGPYVSARECGDGPTFISTNTRLLNTVHALYAWASPSPRVRCQLACLLFYSIYLLLFTADGRSAVRAKLRGGLKFRSDPLGSVRPRPAPLAGPGPPP